MCCGSERADVANCVGKLPTCLAKVELNSGRMLTAMVKPQDAPQSGTLIAGGRLGHVMAFPLVHR